MVDGAEVAAVLSGAIGNILGEVVRFDEDKTGIYILDLDADRVALVLEIHEDRIVIRHIHSVFKGRGLGTRIVEAVHECADAFNLEVVAFQVRPDAVTYWEGRGYEPRPGFNREYIRSPGI